MFELVAEGWTRLAEMLRMAPEALAVAMGAGGVGYAAVYGCWRWIQLRRADPVAGSSLSGFLGISAPEDRLMRGTVTKVFDGNTLEIGGTRTVRLIGIEAPENRNTDKLRRDARQTGVSPSRIVEQGRRAHDWLQQEIAGKMVEVEFDPFTCEEDHHGQTLAHVWTVDRRGRKGVHLGELIVWEGHAVPREERHAYRARINEARTRAMKAGRGGNLGVSVPPASQESTFSASDDNPTTTSELGIFSSLSTSGEEGESVGKPEGKEKASPSRQIQNPRYWRPEE